eukprot:5569438-Pleurochrysis_carterae.AAC.1
MRGCASTATTQSMTPLARREMIMLTGAFPLTGGAPSGSTASSTRPPPAPWHCWYRRPAADVGCPRVLAYPVGTGRPAKCHWRAQALTRLAYSGAGPPAGGKEQWTLAARRAPRTCVGNAPRSCGGVRGCQRGGSE